MKPYCFLAYESFAIVESRSSSIIEEDKQVAKKRVSVVVERDSALEKCLYIKMSINSILKYCVFLIFCNKICILMFDTCKESSKEKKQIWFNQVLLLLELFVIYFESDPSSLIFKWRYLVCVLINLKTLPTCFCVFFLVISTTLKSLSFGRNECPDNRNLWSMTSTLCSADWTIFNHVKANFMLLFKKSELIKHYYFNNKKYTSYL